MPTAYQLFVKKHMLAMHGTDMSATDKFRHIAHLWHESKGEKHHMQADSDDERAPAPRRRKPASRRMPHTGDIDLSQLLTMLK